jgi:hypothetical protein
MIPTSLLACSVCFGDPNSSMSIGTRMGVLFLLVVVVGTLAVLARLGYRFLRRDNRFNQSE